LVTIKEEGFTMKRMLIIFLAAMLLLTAIAGCSAASTTQKGNNENFDPVATTTAGSNDKGGTAELPAPLRKIIKNVALDLRSKDVEATYNELLAYAVQYGGYEIYRTQQTSTAAITIDAQIKIKPGQLDDFVKYIGSRCEIISNQTSTEDITAQYYDATTRLQTMEKTLITYYTFLDNANNIDESLKVQTEINQLTLQIESLKGQIKLWDSLLAESTVTIRLRQVTDPVQIKKEINWSTLTFNDMGYLMQSGLTWLLNVLVVFVQWVAIALVVTSPLWIVALLIIWLVFRHNRKIRKQRQRALAAQAQADTNKPVQ
jgi:hypothetical protein